MGNEIENEIDRYSKKFTELFIKNNKKNFQCSAFLFDLVSLTDLRPNNGVWRDMLEEDMTEEEEKEVFKILIEYALLPNMDKYGVGIDKVITMVKNILGLKVDTAKSVNRYEIFKYMTNLISRVNLITKNLLDNLEYNTFINLDVMLDVKKLEKDGYFNIDKLHIDIKDNTFGGYLIIFVVEKVKFYA